ncbi:hypothetical protein C8R46DRAFT_1229980 [Mycena filopes]|nr:hypothetical protein C8R46DRAFT_1229980 [Mycena filopes]
MTGHIMQASLPPLLPPRARYSEPMFTRPFFCNYFYFSSIGFHAYNASSDLISKFYKAHADPTGPGYMAAYSLLQARLATIYAVAGIQEALQDRAILAARADVDAALELMTDEFVGAWGPYFSHRSARLRRKRVAAAQQAAAAAAAAAQHAAELQLVQQAAAAAAAGVSTIAVADLPDIPLDVLFDSDTLNALEDGWGTATWDVASPGEQVEWGWAAAAQPGAGWGGGGWDNLPRPSRAPIRFEQLRPWAPLRIYRFGRSYALALQDRHPHLQGMSNPVGMLRALRRYRRQKERARRRDRRRHFLFLMPKPLENGSILATRGPNAPLQAYDACAVPLFPSATFKGFLAHETHGMRNYFFIVHNGRARVFTDSAGWQSFHRNQLEEIEMTVYSQLRPVSHRAYEWCLENHHHLPSNQTLQGGFQAVLSAPTIPDVDLLIWNPPAPIERPLRSGAAPAPVAEEAPGPRAQGPALSPRACGFDAPPPSPGPAGHSSFSFFAFSDGRVILDAAEATRRLEQNHALQVKVVAGLAEARDWFHSFPPRSISH